MVGVKGQIKPEEDWRAVDSPKKESNEFVLFVFLLFMANKTNSFVRFLGESMARPNCFWFYMTFNPKSKELKCSLIRDFNLNVCCCEMEVTKQQQPGENTTVLPSPATFFSRGFLCTENNVCQKSSKYYMPLNVIIMSNPQKLVLYDWQVWLPTVELMLFSQSH